MDTDKAIGLLVQVLVLVLLVVLIVWAVGQLT